MPLGPGKYNEFATFVREAAEAEGAAVIVIKGRHGNGFSVQGSAEVTMLLPTILRTMADEIEASVKMGRT